MARQARGVHGRGGRDAPRALGGNGRSPGCRPRDGAPARS